MKLCVKLISEGTKLRFISFLKKNCLYRWNTTTLEGQSVFLRPKLLIPSWTSYLNYGHRCTVLRQVKKLHPSILQRESNISVISDRWRTKIRLKCKLQGSSRAAPGFFSGGDSYQALAFGAARQNTHCFGCRRGFSAQSDLLIKSQGNENNLERCDLHLRLSESYDSNVAL